jgi:hypothetical protein
VKKIVIVKNLKKTWEICKMLKNANKKNKKRTSFFCEKCDFTTSHKPNYERHLLTIEHCSVTKTVPMLTKKNEKEPLLCSCGKKYKHLPSLLRHQKECPFNKLDEIIRQNQEFKELLVEQNRENKLLQEKIINMKPVINQFNLNVFLNETCKEAISMTEFINTLPIGITDLEYVGKNGFVEGISHIFLKGLRNLDITKRPIHCCDLKRDILYIKDKTWERDIERTKITLAIKNIAQKNLKQITNWTHNNPSYADPKSVKNTDYLNIVKESVAEMEENNQKIIKIISKETIIEK